MKRAKLLFGRSEPAPEPVAPKKAATRFHAVTIVPGPRACAASLDLREQRFLSREAHDAAAEEVRQQQLRLPVPASRRPPQGSSPCAGDGRIRRRLFKRRTPHQAEARPPQGRHVSGGVRRRRLSASPAPRRHRRTDWSAFLAEGGHRAVAGNEGHVVAERPELFADRVRSARRGRRAENRCGRSSRRTARRRRWRASTEHGRTPRDPACGPGVLHLQDSVADAAPCRRLRASDPA